VQVVMERFDGKISELNSELVKMAYKEVKQG
jgi:hypothetical protein